MILVDNVCKGYNGRTILHGVNLSVSMGEIHGLIGENGAGKTTLIKCIAGIYKPDAGTVLFDDKEIYDTPETKLRVGYVSDRSDYIGSYSIKRIVRMYENFYHGFNREKFEKYNELFALDVNKKIHSLSKGQKMRLGFMLETAKEPDYLILDEPTSGLDPVAKARFLEFLVDEVDKRGIGVLISSHNLYDLEKLCDTITMMSEGKVVNNSSLDDFKSELVKLQVVFENGIDEIKLNIPNVVKVSHVGGVYSLIVDGYEKMMEEILRTLGASFMEVIDISLEELFIALEEIRGNR